MSAFKQLRDVSNTFEQQLRNASVELFSAKIGETFEDGITKKMQDLTFLTSKLRFLKAKSVAPFPEVVEPPASDDTKKEYGELAMWKVLEQAIVKSLTQAHSVRALISTPDQDLQPELVHRKEKIIQSLKEYRNQETQLRRLHSIEIEKEEELAVVREQWNEELSRLRDLQEESTQFEECDVSDPLYKKLRTLVDKLEVMRWLVCRLVTSHGAHDWLADPSRSSRALRLARTHNTVHMFVDSTGE